MINYAKNKINSFCVSEEKEDEASRNGNINQTSFKISFETFLEPILFALNSIVAVEEWEVFKFLTKVTFQEIQ